MARTLRQRLEDEAREFYIGPFDGVVHEEYAQKWEELPEEDPLKRMIYQIVWERIRYGDTA